MQVNNRSKTKGILIYRSDSNVKNASNIIKKMIADYNKAVSTVRYCLLGKGGAFQGQLLLQCVRQAMT